MRIADVIGTVTLNRAHPSVAGATWKLVVPLTWDNLLGRSDEPAEELVVFDALGAGGGRASPSAKAARPPCPSTPTLNPWTHTTRRSSIASKLWCEPEISDAFHVVAAGVISNRRV